MLVAGCTCDCCDTIPRRPDEFVAGVKVKCSPSTTHSVDQCSNECRPSQDDQILKTGGDTTLDYQRFCFYECKPADGPWSPKGTACLSLDEKDLSILGDRDGNAADPALIYRPAKTTALVARAPADPVKASQEKAKLEGLKGWRQAALKAAGARAQASYGRAAEEQYASDLAGKLKAMGIIKKSNIPGGANEMAFYGAVQDIHSAMMATGVAARGAAEAAQRAVAAVRLARKRSWDAALDEGKASMEAVKAEAVAKAKKDADMAARLQNDNQIKAAAAAAKASEPYFISMLRAQQEGKNYRARGEQNAAEARDDDAQAKKLAAKANALNAGGKSTEAQNVIMEARKVALAGQALAKQARQMFATAKEIDLSIPKYQAAAQAAAARAAFESNPEWNPGANTR